MRFVLLTFSYRPFYYYDTAKNWRYKIDICEKAHHPKNFNLSMYCNELSNSYSYSVYDIPVFLRRTTTQSTTQQNK